MRILSAFCALLLWASAAQAQIVITLDQNSLSGAAGQVLTFKGVISNKGTQEVFLNSDTLNVGNKDFTAVDFFFANLPTSLLGGQSSADLELFYVIGGPGVSGGSYTLFGGSNTGAQDRLASVDLTFGAIQDRVIAAVNSQGGTKDSGATTRSAAPEKSSATVTHVLSLGERPSTSTAHEASSMR